MSATLKIVRGLDASGKFLAQVVFGGTYVTGGDALNLTTYTDPSALGAPSVLAQPSAVTVYEDDVAGNYFELVRGALPSNWKLQGFAAGGAEFTNGVAYPAAVLAGTVILEIALNPFNG